MQGLLLSRVRGCVQALKEIDVKKSLLFFSACMGVAFLFATAAYSQSSAKSLYDAKCQVCHGATGLANSGIGLRMKVKPVTDPSVYNMSDAEMVREVREGAGKMEPYKGTLTDAQIRALVDYFKTFIKKP
jgi:mono/diheme cytochrome c family protein